MLEHLKPGVKIRAIGPSGIFSFHRHHQESFQAPVATEAGAKPLDDVTPDAGARSGIPTSASVLLVVAAIAWVVVHRPVFGRHLDAVGNNEAAARFSGIRTDLVTIAAYALAAHPRVAMALREMLRDRADQE